MKIFQRVSHAITICRVVEPTNHQQIVSTGKHIACKDQISRSNTVCGIRVLIAGYGAATRWIFQLNDETIITSEVDYARTF